MSVGSDLPISDKTEKKDNNFYLCTECRDYVPLPHSHEIKALDGYFPKPKPPYCVGCGIMMPQRKDLCQSCRIYICGMLDHAPFSQDLVKACANYVKKRKREEEEENEQESESDEE